MWGFFSQLRIHSGKKNIWLFFPTSFTAIGNQLSKLESPESCHSDAYLTKFSSLTYVPRAAFTNSPHLGQYDFLPRLLTKSLGCHASHSVRNLWRVFRSLDCRFLNATDENLPPEAMAHFGSSVSRNWYTRLCTYPSCTFQFANVGHSRLKNCVSAECRSHPPTQN